MGGVSNIVNQPDEQPQRGGSNGATAELRSIVCPYCGAEQPPGERCRDCGGIFEPLSRQATQNQMGPWSIRIEDQPFRPGCSYATLRRLVARGKVRPDAVIRGPTTRQFWARARDVPGVAHLLGECHHCRERASPDDYMCAACGAVFSAPEDRQFLGLGPVRLLPGQAPPEVVARSSFAQSTDAPRPGVADASPPRSPSSERPLTLPRPQAASVSETVDRTVDAPAPGGSATARLKRRIGRLQMIIAALMALNLLLLVIFLIAMNPRVRFGVGQGGAPPQEQRQQAPPPPAEEAPPPGEEVVPEG